MNVVFAPSGMPALARNRAIGTFPIEQTNVATAIRSPTTKSNR